MSKKIACVDKKHVLEVENLVYPSSKHPKHTNPGHEDDAAELDYNTRECSGFSTSVVTFDDVEIPGVSRRNSSKDYHAVSRGDIATSNVLSSSVDVRSLEKENIGETGINDNPMIPSTKIEREMKHHDVDKSKSSYLPNPYTCCKRILHFLSDRPSGSSTSGSLDSLLCAEVIDKDKQTSSSNRFMTERDENLSKKQKCESLETQQEKLEFADLKDSVRSNIFSDQSSMVYDDYFNEEMALQFIFSESEAVAFEASKDAGQSRVREATIDKEFEQYFSYLL